METQSQKVKRAWITRRRNGNDIPWNKGKKTGALSDKHRKKISDALIGYLRSPEEIKKSMETKWRTGKVITPVKKGGNHSWGKKIGKSLIGNKNGKIGKDHWNWQGGITPINAKARNSKRYKNWRGKVFKRDDWTCQNCGARSKKGKRVRLEADHIKPFSLYPKLRYKVSNGRTLCYKCHNLIGWQLFKDANPRKNL